jgi:hypothetical protein
MRLRRVVVGAACVAAASPLVLTGGPAGAAPIDFRPGERFEAICTTAKAVTLEPVPGNGLWTPYKVSNGQMFVPTSFTLTSDMAGLKSRHLTPAVQTVSKAGPPGSTTCEVWGTALGTDGQPVDFTATMVGNLVGKASPTP